MRGQTLLLLLLGSLALVHPRAPAAPRATSEQLVAEGDHTLSPDLPDPPDDDGLGAARAPERAAPIPPSPPRALARYAIAAGQQRRELVAARALLARPVGTPHEHPHLGGRVAAFATVRPPPRA